MAGGRLKDVLRRFNRQLAAPAISEWTDRQLLEHFANRHDEMAFAALVRRHGPLVLGAGRRIFTATKMRRTCSRRPFSSWPEKLLPAVGGSRLPGGSTASLPGWRDEPRQKPSGSASYTRKQGRY